MRSMIHPTNRGKPWIRRVVLMLFGLLLFPASARADEIAQLVVGLGYIANVEGEQSELDLIATPIVASYRIDRLQVKVSTPYLTQANPTSDGYSEPDEQGVGTAKFQSGIGDMNVALSYTTPLSNRIWIDITGKVKFPTGATSARLGTGSTDWSLQGEMTRQIGSSGVSLRVGKKFSGPSEFHHLVDPWNVGLGGFVTVGDFTLAADYDRRESSFEGGIDRDELTLSVSHNLRPRLRMQGYGFLTIAGRRSDVGLGTQVVVRIGS